MLGLFIGIVVGLALAAAVAFYLTRGATPYQSTGQSRDSSREPAKELAKPGRADGFAPDKPRFDFYRILPGNEEAKIQPKPAERPADKSTAERAVSPDKADAKSASKAGHRPWGSRNFRAMISGPNLVVANSTSASSESPSGHRGEARARARERRRRAAERTCILFQELRPAIKLHTTNPAITATTSTPTAHARERTG